MMAWGRETTRMYEYATNRVPLRQLSESTGVLALIHEVLGTSYRTVGTMMAFMADGRRVGSLSSGCIEDDIAEHAKAALTSGQAKSLRYGTGSPFFDLKLPCGGGLSILLVPNPDQAVLRHTWLSRIPAVVISTNSALSCISAIVGQPQ